MAQNYVSNQPLLIENEPVNTPQNQVIIKSKPARKPRQIKYKSISQQLGTRIEEPENGQYLKGLKTKKALFQVLKSHYDIPEELYKKTTLKNKNEMIDLLLKNKDDYIKGSSKPKAGGSTIQTEPKESLSNEAIEPIIQKESTVKQPKKVKIRQMKAPTLIQSTPEPQSDLTSDSSLINLYEPESKVTPDPAPNNFNQIYNNDVNNDSSLNDLYDFPSKPIEEIMEPINNAKERRLMRQEDVRSRGERSKEQHTRLLNNIKALGDAIATSKNT
jgi:hypothetical protein